MILIKLNLIPYGKIPDRRSSYLELLLCPPFTLRLTFRLNSTGEGKQLDEKTHYEMPDREQYLESLEAKLRKIKGNKKTEREEARRMVQEMQIHKEDRWGSAMHDVIPIDFSGDFQEDPCAAPFIVRCVNGPKLCVGREWRRE